MRWVHPSMRMNKCKPCKGHTNTKESRNDTNTDGLTKRLKLWTIKWFSEDVNLLILDVDEFKKHHFLLYQVKNKMISNLNMLWLWVLYWVLGEINSTFIITKNAYGILRDSIIMKKLLYPQELTTKTTGSNVLYFSG